MLLITLVSILVTQYVKKRRKAKGTKNSEKNVYRKRDRYVKKLHLVKDELVDPEAPTEEPAESASAEEPVEESTDAPAPEAPAEESAEPATEAAPEVEDAPAEPSPTDDGSDENKE